MDGSLTTRDERREVLVTRLLSIRDFERAREVVREWANEYQLQPCTTIAAEHALLISYHDEARASVNYGCCRYEVPYAPGQALSFKQSYQSARDGW
jgi:hypothetical protein